MKLTIVVKWYPPDLRVPARRWGNLVDSLQQNGVTCTVISAGDGRFVETIGAAGERVIRLPISNFDGASGAASAKTLLRRMRSSVRRGVLAAWPPVLREFDARQWLLQVRTCPELTRIAVESDYIVSSYGPLGPFVLGRRLARGAGKPWIADIRDSIDFKDGLVLAPARRVSRMLEGYLLGNARLRITIGATLARYLSNLYRMRFHEIYNGWTDGDLIYKRDVTDAEGRYLYYAGSIYAHRLPALDVVCQAIRMKPGVKLKLRLLKDHTQGELRKLIACRGVSEQVELLPPVEQKVVDAELAGALAALVLEDLSGESELMNGIVTGKLLGLLASGIPGIAVSAKNGEIRHLVSDVDGWYGVDAVEQFLEALGHLGTHSGHLTSVGRLRDYHMSEQTSRLLRLIRDAQ